MKKLGQLLVEREWLTSDQLHQALNHQRLFGGRLGTCLLELNLLSEERLVKALSEELRVPVVTAEELRHIDATTLELVPTKLACRSRLVPFERTATGVSVALVDVRDLALQDELAFVTSKRVKAFVAPEVRILEALEKHYSCDVELRYQRIWDRMNRARYLWQEEGTPAAADPQAGAKPQAGAAAPDRQPPQAASASGTWSLTPPPALDSPRGGPVPPPAATAVAATEARASPTGGPAFLSQVAESQAAGSQAPESHPAESPPAPDGSSPRRSRPTEVEVPEEFRGLLESAPERDTRGAPTTLAELEERFANADQRDAIAEALLAFLRHRFPRVLLLMVRGAEVAGWMGDGAGVDQARLLALEIGFDEPSFFLNLREGSPYCRGPLPRMDAHQRLAEVWGGRLPREAVLLPVRLKERLVAVVYCDAAGEPMGAVDIAELQQASARTGQAFQELLMRMKKKQRGS